MATIERSPWKDRAVTEGKKREKRADEDAIRSLYQAMERTCRQIVLEKAQGSRRAAIERYGLTVEERSNRNEEIHERWAMGWSRKRIARHFGLKRSQVSRVIGSFGS